MPSLTLEREFLLKRIPSFGYAIFIFLWGAFPFIQPNYAVANSPNVLVIYTDDQGTLDANCYGSEDLITPAIDRLAETGIRLTQMYSPSCICSASRAGLLTGRIPVRAGVPGNVSSEKGKPGLPASEYTMAEMFHDAGYATYHVGKWHLGFTPETMPNGQGFESSFGHMGGCIDNYSHYFFWNGPNRHDLWRNGTEIHEDGQFFPDLMVREVKSAIDATKERPFFIYWAINVPHYPYQGTHEWRKKYADLPSPRREYAEFVSTMDQKVGQILDFLEQRKLREETIVVFQSDHGHSTEERAFFGGGNAGPYRGAKGCLFEGGIRVPSLISWPQKIPAGETRDQMATGCDWMPTLASLAEIPPPENMLDGRDISQCLLDEDQKSPHNFFYWQMGNGNNAQWAVRQGDWKLLGNCRDTSNQGELSAQDKKSFLINLKSDPGESKNVADTHAELVQQLMQLRSQTLDSMK
ncbi:MAG TPA: sulfatase [Planctomycetaceae bacterium]|nr:sulfatase [Planctomycetaceae bacterium]